MIKKLINLIKTKWIIYKKKQAFKKAIGKYKKQDPFNYKNF
jgi:hypothetical protein